jgi:hypothetical protein
MYTQQNSLEQRIENNMKTKIENQQTFMPTE